MSLQLTSAALEEFFAYVASPDNATILQRAIAKAVLEKHLDAEGHIAIEQSYTLSNETVNCIHSVLKNSKATDVLQGTIYCTGSFMSVSSKAENSQALVLQGIVDQVIEI
jgi:hypothetical protein